MVLYGGNIREWFLLRLYYILRLLCYHNWFFLCFSSFSFFGEGFYFLAPCHHQHINHTANLFVTPGANACGYYDLLIDRVSSGVRRQMETASSNELATPSAVGMGPLRMGRGRHTAIRWQPLSQQKSDNHHAKYSVMINVKTRKISISNNNFSPFSVGSCWIDANKHHTRDFHTKIKALWSHRLVRALTFR